MKVLVGFKDVWESQYQDQFIIDTDKLDMSNKDHIAVNVALVSAMADEDKSLTIPEFIYEAIDNALSDVCDGKDSFILSEIKGHTIDEEVDLWYGE